jgi:tetratricopeptide (TPR) repeat protein
VRTICVAVAISLAITAPAGAQTPPSAPNGARQYVEAGITALDHGEWEIALQQFRLAQRAVPLSPEIFQLLAVACERAGGRELEAIGWYRAYLALAPASRQTVDALLRIDELEKRVAGIAEKLATDAWELADVSRATVRAGVDYSLDDLLRAQAVVGRVTYAMQGARPLPGRERGDAEIVIVLAAAQQGDFKGAERVIADMIDAEARDHSLGLLAAAQAERGQLAEADRTLARIRDPDQLAWAHTEVAANYAIDTSPGGIQRFIARTPQSVRTADFWEVVGYAYAGSGDAAGVRSITARLSDPATKDRIVGALVEHHIGTGELAAARQASAAIIDPVSRAVALVDIARAYVSRGDATNARALLATAVGRLPPKSWGIAVAARAYAAAGDWKTALDMAAKVPDDNRNDVLTDITEAQAAAKDFAGAKQTAMQITEPGWRNLALSYIAQALALAGDPGGAMAVTSDLTTPFDRDLTATRVRMRPRLPPNAVTLAERKAAAWVSYVDSLVMGLSFGVRSMRPAVELRRILEMMPSWPVGDQIGGLAVAASELMTGLREAARLVNKEKSR